MNYLDLFSGIGGFALGAYFAGMHFENHYFSEVDKYAINVYQKRFPDSVGLGDIKQIKGETLPYGNWIISGGFPCQDISIAGTGLGLDGERSGLFFEYLRLIDEIRPNYAIMENVGALAIRGLDKVLGSLSEIGYDAEWQDIRASDVGASHKRERIWIVAYPNSDKINDDNTRYGTSAIFGEKSKKTEISGFMADADSSGLEGRQEHRECTDKRITRQGCKSFAENWKFEPDVGRLANGISHRVDRLKCLGNSIVPQIAYLIFNEIRKNLG